MGMSASQARFLSLTARKNNVEFEGQQINQQRTCLSNESASYYSELCNMSVPTPPSIDDYTKVTYSFDDGAMTNTIMSILPDKDDKTKYNISYVESWQDDYAIVPSASSMVQMNGSGTSATYSIGGQQIRTIGESDKLKIGSVDGKFYKILTTNDPAVCNPFDDGYYYIEINPAEVISDSQYGAYGKYLFGGDYVPVSGINGSQYIRVDADDDGNYTTYEEMDADEAEEELNNYFKDDPYASTLTLDQKIKMLQTENYYLSMLRDKFGDDEKFQIRYVKNTTTGSYEPQFFADAEVKNASKYNNKNLASVACYGLGSVTQSREVLGQSGRIEKDSSGRYVAITLELKDGNDKTVERTYSLTTTTTTDEGAYNDAMNQYTYKQHEYEHKIQEINSKLEIIQQQDKQLELKLKQLDTEENAISTELDAVKKVISKNVDSSFKTFG